MRIPIFDLRVDEPDLKAELMGAFSRVLDHGRLFMGPEVEEFEEKSPSTSDHVLLLGLAPEVARYTWH